MRGLEGVEENEALKRLREADEAGREVFMTYLKNIETINVVEGKEDILTAFEFQTSVFDEYLLNHALLMNMIQRAEGDF